jgi:hypothetical protein
VKRDLAAWLMTRKVAARMVDVPAAIDGRLQNAPKRPVVIVAAINTVGW